MHQHEARVDPATNEDKMTKVCREKKVMRSKEKNEEGVRSANDSDVKPICRSNAKSKPLNERNNRIRQD